MATMIYEEYYDDEDEIMYDEEVIVDDDDDDDSAYYEEEEEVVENQFASIKAALMADHLALNSHPASPKKRRQPQQYEEMEEEEEEEEEEEVEILEEEDYDFEDEEEEEVIIEADDEFAFVKAKLLAEHTAMNSPKKKPTQQQGNKRSSFENMKASLLSDHVALNLDDDEEEVEEEVEITEYDDEECIEEVLMSPFETIKAALKQEQEEMKEKLRAKFSDCESSGEFYYGYDDDDDDDDGSFSGPEIEIKKCVMQELQGLHGSFDGTVSVFSAISGDSGDDLSDGDYEEIVIEKWFGREEMPDNLEEACLAMIPYVYKGQDVNPETMMRRTPLPELYKYLKQHVDYKNLKKEGIVTAEEKDENEPEEEQQTLEDLLISRLAKAQEQENFLMNKLAKAQQQQQSDAGNVARAGEYYSSHHGGYDGAYYSGGDYTTPAKEEKVFDDSKAYQSPVVQKPKIRTSDKPKSSINVAKPKSPVKKTAPGRLDMSKVKLPESSSSPPSKDAADGSPTNRTKPARLNLADVKLPGGVKATSGPQKPGNENVESFKTKKSPPGRSDASKFKLESPARTSRPLDISKFNIVTPTKTIGRLDVSKFNKNSPTSASPTRASPIRASPARSSPRGRIDVSKFNAATTKSNNNAAFGGGTFKKDVSRDSDSSQLRIRKQGNFGTAQAKIGSQSESQKTPPPTTTTTKSTPSKVERTETVDKSTIAGGNVHGELGSPASSSQAHSTTGEGKTGSSNASQRKPGRLNMSKFRASKPTSEAGKSSQSKTGTQWKNPGKFQIAKFQATKSKTPERNIKEPSNVGSSDRVTTKPKPGRINTTQSKSAEKDNEKDKKIAAIVRKSFRIQQTGGETAKPWAVKPAMSILKSPTKKDGADDATATVKKVVESPTKSPTKTKPARLNVENLRSASSGNLGENNVEHKEAKSPVKIRRMIKPSNKESDGGIESHDKQHAAVTSPILSPGRRRTVHAGIPADKLLEDQEARRKTKAGTPEWLTRYKEMGIKDGEGENAERSIGDNAVNVEQNEARGAVKVRRKVMPTHRDASNKDNRGRQAGETAKAVRTRSLSPTKLAAKDIENQEAIGPAKLLRRRVKPTNRNGSNNNHIESRGKPHEASSMNPKPGRLNMEPVSRTLSSGSRSLSSGNLTDMVAEPKETNSPVKIRRKLKPVSRGDNDGNDMRGKPVAGTPTTTKPEYSGSTSPGKSPLEHEEGRGPFKVKRKVKQASGDGNDDTVNRGRQVAVKSASAFKPRTRSLSPTKLAAKDQENQEAISPSKLRRKLKPANAGSRAQPQEVSPTKSKPGRLNMANFRSLSSGNMGEKDVENKQQEAKNSPVKIRRKLKSMNVNSNDDIDNQGKPEVNLLSPVLSPGRRRSLLPRNLLEKEKTSPILSPGRRRSLLPRNLVEKEKKNSTPEWLSKYKEMGIKDGEGNSEKPVDRGTNDHRVMADSDMKDSSTRSMPIRKEQDIVTSMRSSKSATKPIPSGRKKEDSKKPEWLSRYQQMGITDGGEEKDGHAIEGKKDTDTSTRLIPVLGQHGVSDASTRSTLSVDTSTRSSPSVDTSVSTKSKSSVDASTRSAPGRGQHTLRDASTRSSTTPTLENSTRSMPGRGKTADKVHEVRGGKKENSTPEWMSRYKEMGIKDGEEKGCDDQEQKPVLDVEKVLTRSTSVVGGEKDQLNVSTRSTPSSVDTSKRSTPSRWSVPSTNNQARSSVHNQISPPQRKPGKIDATKFQFTKEKQTIPTIGSPSHGRLSSSPKKSSNFQKKSKVGVSGSNKADPDEKGESGDGVDGEEKPKEDPSSTSKKEPGRLDMAKFRFAK